MGLLDYNLDNVKEPDALPEGEYLLEVIQAEDKLDKNGNPGIKILFRSDQPNTKPIGGWISLPPEDADEEEVSAILSGGRGGKAFVTAFRVVKHDSAEDLIGLQGYALLSETESEEYGKQNRIKRFIEGR